MFDSVARNNIVNDEEQGIVISESHNNEIYNNTVSNSDRGIDIDVQSNENIIHDNIIRNTTNPSDALYVEEGATKQNTLYSNILVSSNGERINLDQLNSD